MLMSLFCVRSLHATDYARLMRETKLGLRALCGVPVVLRSVLGAAPLLKHAPTHF